MKEISDYKYNKLMELPEANKILNELDFDINKIYIYVGNNKSLYKLNQVSYKPNEELFAWVDFKTSWGLANDSWNIDLARIEINKKDVYVFNHPVELAQWLLEFYNCK